MTPSGKSESLKPLKWYKDLANFRDRLGAGAFPVEGEKAIDQILSGYPDQVIEIISTAELSSRYGGHKVRIVSENQLKSISSTRTPQGIIAIVHLPLDTYSDTLPEKIGTKLLLLEDIQDPGNAGTLIRTAAAFDFSGLIMSDKSADPFSAKCVQSTAGTLLSLWIRRTKNYLDIARRLKEKGYRLIATDLAGDADPSILKNSGKFILALGNEAAGLSRNLLEVADYRVRIPLNSKKAESLNVAITGAICMFLSTQDK